MKSFRGLLCGGFVCWAVFLLASPQVFAQSHEETALWDGVKDSKDAEDYRAYLDKYPDGIYAPIAKRRITVLEAASHAPAPGPGAAADNPNLDYPSVMHFCAAHCTTWNFKDGRTGDGQYGVKISHWTPDSVILDRTDPPNQYFPRGLKAVISGHMSPEHDKLVDCKITWTFGQPGTHDCKLTWGSALNDIPGQDGPPPPPVSTNPPPQASPNPSAANKSLPTDEAANAQIDAGFRRWSAGWMFDRYVPGSIRTTDRALKEGTYVVRGLFDFVRGGGRLSIPFAAAYSNATDHFALSNLCYNDVSTGQTDCTDPNNPAAMQSRQFLGSIVLLGMAAAMASDETCVKRYTLLGSAYLECYD